MLKALICVGALDELEKNRKKLYDSLDHLEEISHYNERHKQDSSLSLFAENLKEITIDLQETGYWNFKEQLEKEYEILYFYLSKNPLEFYKQEITFYKDSNKIKDLLNSKEKYNVVCLLCGKYLY